PAKQPAVRQNPSGSLATLIQAFWFQPRCSGGASSARPSSMSARSIDGPSFADSSTIFIVSCSSSTSGIASPVLCARLSHVGLVSLYLLGQGVRELLSQPWELL